MRFKCIRRPQVAADNVRDLGTYRQPERNEYDLVIGREYVAMGLGFWDGQVRVEVATAGGFILSVPVTEFQVVSGRPSTLWEARVSEDGVFRLWPPSFYSHAYHSDLADRATDVVADFERVRAELVAEDQRQPLRLER